MMKKITSLLLLWVMVLPLWAQFHDPVSFSVSQKKLSDSEFEIVFTGKAEAGWHVYSTDIPDGGPTPATINFDEQKVEQEYDYHCNHADGTWKGA